MRALSHTRAGYSRDEDAQGSGGSKRRDKEEARFAEGRLDFLSEHLLLRVLLIAAHLALQHRDLVLREVGALLTIDTVSAIALLAQDTVSSTYPSRPNLSLHAHNRDAIAQARSAVARQSGARPPRAAESPNAKGLESMAFPHHHSKHAERAECYCHPHPSLPCVSKGRTNLGSSGEKKEDLFLDQRHAERYTAA